MADEQRPKRPPFYLRSHREVAGIRTQPELARLIEARSPEKTLSVPTISLIEGNEEKGTDYGYSMDAVVAIARALEIEPWLLFIKPEPNAIWAAMSRLAAMLPPEAASDALSGMIAGARTHLDKTG